MIIKLKNLEGRSIAHVKSMNGFFKNDIWVQRVTRKGYVHEITYKVMYVAYVSDADGIIRQRATVKKIAEDTKRDG